MVDSAGAAASWPASAPPPWCCWSLVVLTGGRWPTTNTAGGAGLGGVPDRRRARRPAPVRADLYQVRRTEFGVAAADRGAAVVFLGVEQGILLAIGRPWSITCGTATHPRSSVLAKSPAGQLALAAGGARGPQHRRFVIYRFAPASISSPTASADWPRRAPVLVGRVRPWPGSAWTARRSGTWTTRRLVLDWSSTSCAPPHPVGLLQHHRPGGAPTWTTTADREDRRGRLLRHVGEVLAAYQPGAVSGLVRLPGGGCPPASK